MRNEITVWVVSGEGTTGTSRLTRSRSEKGLRRILTVERAGGDRWARLEMETPDQLRMPAEIEHVLRAVRCALGNRAN